MAVKPKVFIVGISGFVGYQLALHLREKFLISGATFTNDAPMVGAQIFSVSLQNLEVLEGIIRVQSPDFVINAMGLTDKQEIENSQKLAESLNVMLAVSLAAVASKIRVKFIQLSCAEIYDGADGNYKETDNDFTLHDNLGKQKVTAETYIRAQTLESTILRLGKVVGLGTPQRTSYFDRIRATLAKREAVETSVKKCHSYLSGLSVGRALEAILLGEFTGKHRIFNVGGVNMSERDFVLGWCRLLGIEEKFAKVPTEDTRRDLTLQSDALQAAFPAWRPESANELYLNLLRDLSPGIGTKKWDKQLGA